MGLSYRLGISGNPYAYHGGSGFSLVSFARNEKADARAHTLTLFSTGLDLSGNTYWEFRLTRGDPTVSHNLKNNDSSFSASHQQAYPFRRMVHYPRSTHFSEVKVPPAWHQWLRYMRAAPPTLDEQRADVARGRGR